MNKRKQEGGITLIALVITIVIVIILAAITINLTLGNGSLAEKAKEGADSYKEAQEQEKDMIDNFEANIMISEEGYNSQEGVNEPVLTEGMIPVTWNGTSWIKADATKSDWYEYGTINKQWANVVTVKESGTKSRTEYMSSTVGTEILEDDIVGMYVWIPRYSYRITSGYHENANGTGNVDIKFLKGTTDNYEGGEAIRSNVTNGEKFVVHPSFTKDKTQGGSKETTGYWVAKFEASSEQTLKNNSNITNESEESIKQGGGNTDQLEVTVRPNVTSWRNIDVINIYKVCRNITKEGNIQGLTNKVDPHMMKGSEWGGVAYLSQSAYGNKQGTDPISGIWNNSYNEGIVSKVEDNGNNYGGVNSYAVTLTGAVGSTRDESTSFYAEQTGITGKDTNEITISYTVYAKDGTTSTLEKTYYKYNTANGMKGSTTGNIYGIYDMSGGAWEFTADYLKEATNEYVKYFKQNVEGKYKTEHEGSGVTGSEEDRTINYNANSKRYGNAIWETSGGANGVVSWNGDNGNFAYLNFPFYIYGGRFSGSVDLGVFCFRSNTGKEDIGFSFRPVLSI